MKPRVTFNLGLMLTIVNMVWILVILNNANWNIQNLTNIATIALIIILFTTMPIGLYIILFALFEH